MNKLITSLTLTVLSLIVSVPFFGHVYAANIELLPQADSPFINAANATYDIPRLVSFAITVVLIFAALAFFFMLVLGGIRWILSGGEKGNVENARKQITNALIGLAIIFVAWAIIRLLATVFGVNILSLPMPTL